MQYSAQQEATVNIAQGKADAARIAAQAAADALWMKAEVEARAYKAIATALEGPQGQERHAYVKIWLLERVAQERSTVFDVTFICLLHTVNSFVGRRLLKSSWLKSTYLPSITWGSVRALCYCQRTLRMCHL